MAGAESCDAAKDDIDETSIRMANKGNKNNTNVSEHLEAANRAISDLRYRAVEFTWERSVEGTIQIDAVRQLVAPAIPDMDTDLRINKAYKTGEVKSDHEILNFFALQAVCGIYDLCYLTAWKVPFPSQPEQALWRLFCGLQFLLISFSLLWICIRLCYVNVKAWRSQSEYINFGEKAASKRLALSFRYGGYWDRLMTRALMYTGVLVMVLARLYFLVESYISLRSPPPHTYDTVNWTLVIPHIS